MNVFRSARRNDLIYFSVFDIVPFAIHVTSARCERPSHTRPYNFEAYYTLHHFFRHGSHLLNYVHGRTCPTIAVTARVLDARLANNITVVGGHDRCRASCLLEQRILPAFGEGEIGLRVAQLISGFCLLEAFSQLLSNELRLTLDEKL